LRNMGASVSHIWDEEPNPLLIHIFVHRPGMLLQPSLSNLTCLQRFVVSSQSDSAVLGKRTRSVDELASVQGGWRRGWYQLDDDDVWKRFGDYWRKQNVQTTHDSPSIALAYEEKGEEDPEYRLPLSPDTKNEIIVRDCYKTLYDLIREMRDGSTYYGIVLTGQPGTGTFSS